jgi:hypothetical protein
MFIVPWNVICKVSPFGTGNINRCECLSFVNHYFCIPRSDTLIAFEIREINKSLLLLGDWLICSCSTVRLGKSVCIWPTVPSPGNGGIMVKK